VLSNHDNPRHRTRYGTEARARAAAVLLLGLRGTPFLYAGEELGLADAEVPPERMLDPGGRDGCRAPLPWDDSPGRGWAGEPWLPWPPEPDEHSVAVERDDPTSILHLYRRLLAARRASGALSTGTAALVDAPEGVLAWRRDLDADERLVLVNFTDATVDLGARPELADATVLVSSWGRGEGEPFDGCLTGDEAVILGHGPTTVA
jgi:alpha-glucosidase